MPSYDRTASEGCEMVDRWDDGIGWLAHPEEDGQRVSHAIRSESGVWLFDPLDAPGVTDLIDALGDVAGVAVLSDYHARDGTQFARRYDVPVAVPRSLDRATKRIDAPTERVDRLAGFELRTLRPLGLWQETIAYRERDGTLYVPDFLSTKEAFTVGEERLAMNTLSRLWPPIDRFDGIEPERIICGHGTGIFDGANEALRTALDRARRRFPRALVSQPGAELRALFGALR